MIAESWGGSGFVQHPWLAGMILLFVIEFDEGTSVTRLYFMRVHHLTNDALAQGAVTTELTPPEKNTPRPAPRGRGD
jgi:hypothetical protein